MNIVSSDNSVLISKLSDCDYDLKVGATTFNILTIDTPTVSFTGNGTLNAKLRSNMKISTNPDNKITVDGTGLLVLPDTYLNTDETIKVDNTDSISGYLGNKLQAGTNISLNVVNTGGNKKLVVNATFDRAIYKENTASVNLLGDGGSSTPLTADVQISAANNNALTSNNDGLYVPQVQVTAQSPITTVNSTSISLLSNGTNNHTLTGSVIISPDANNALVQNTNGLFVQSVTSSSSVPLVANDSSSIDFTTTGTDNHTLTGIVKISSNTGNILSVAGSGLFVPSVVSGTINHLSKFVTDSSVGDTALIEAGGLLTIPERVYITSDTGIGIDNTSGVVRLAVSASSYVSAGSFDNLGSIVNTAARIGTRSTTTVNNTASFTHTNAYPVVGSYSSLTLINTAPLVLKPENIYAGLFGFITGSSTSAISNEVISCVAAKVNFTESGTYPMVAGFVAYGPDSVTYPGSPNLFSGTMPYAGVLIKSSQSGTMNSANIINPYGIKQEGATDLNKFEGVIQTSNDIEITNSTKGIILKDTDGSRRRITLSSGTIVISSPL